MSDDKNQELSPEEQKAEEQALVETPDEELRKSVVDDLGLDPEVDEEVINKVVEHRKEEQKRLSTAIRQKRDWREKAQKEPEVEPKAKPQPEPDDFDKKLDEKFRQRELQSLEVSDELRSEVDKYAKLNPELSAKQVYESTYIQFLKKEEEAKARTEEAGISQTHKTKTSQDFSEMTPNDFDVSTPEGRKEYGEWKVWMKQQK